MSRHCTLLVRLVLCVLAAARFAASQGPPQCLVHGSLPAGSQIEFRAPGSPDRKSATAGDKGQYSLSLDPGRYEVTWVQPTAKKFSEMVWISGPEVRLNGEGDVPDTSASGQEYDLLADWRVTRDDSPDNHGVGPAQLTIEAELTSGRTEKLTVWALSSFGDEEKETDAPLQTTPDGRILFRVRDTRLRPDRVVALRIAAVGPAGEKVTRRITPVLEFSASGHLHAIYPDDLTLALDKTVR